MLLQLEVQNDLLVVEERQLLISGPVPDQLLLSGQLSVAGEGFVVLLGLDVLNDLDEL